MPGPRFSEPQAHIRLFHASRDPVVLTSFRPFTHLESMQGARAWSESPAFRNAPARRLYTVDFTTASPLRIPDVSRAPTDWRSLADLLFYKLRVLTPADRDLVCSTSGPGVRGSGEASRALVSILRGLGADSLVYLDRSVGRGADAYLVLDPETSVILSVQELGTGAHDPRR